jgi:hypothetical protein
MRENYAVKALDVLEIWQIAKAQRQRLAQQETDRPDPLCLEHTKELWTTKGTKRFRFEVVPDEAMPSHVAETTYDGDEIVVRVPRHLRNEAFLGVGTARSAVAHELGRATLHLAAFRELAARQRPVYDRVLGPCSSIWQADLFGAAFLIDENTVRLDEHEEVSIQAGITSWRVGFYVSDLRGAVSRPFLPPQLQAIADKVCSATGLR